jgi:hypothetical protein
VESFLIGVTTFRSSNEDSVDAELSLCIDTQRMVDYLESMNGISNISSIWTRMSYLIKPINKRDRLCSRR